MNQIKYANNAKKKNTKTYEKYVASLNNYDEYLKTLNGVINPNLYDLYIKTNRLHNYLIKEIKYNPWKKYINIKFYDRGNIYENTTIRLKQTIKLSWICSPSKKVLKYGNKECIIACEIGYYEGRNYLGFISQNGLKFDVYFNILEIIQNKKSDIK